MYTKAYMIKFNMLFATEARANFFQLLKMVAQGEDVIVINKDSGLKFKITLLNEEVKSGKQFALKQLANVSLKSMSPNEIKKIVANRLSDE